ncbi:MAG: glucose 1-dehydrogenase [Actinobacteria bacterium]|nr:glucose 1-dehydrogenase [Actinomycetota bacterium]
MKAVAVFPGKPNSAHLAELPEPSLDDVAGGRGVLVRVVRVGLDGTDREIDAGQYGAAPEGEDFLVLGHEGFGIVEAAGPAVRGILPGDHVVSRVRRAGSGFYDRLDMPDLTTEDTYLEHGISRVHGFLTERYVEDARYLTIVPEGLREVGVLLEPTSVVEKGIAQAFEIQRRLKVWRPERAAVLGVGTIGLLAAMALRNRGLEVTAFGLEEPPFLNSELVEALGASYVSTGRTSLEDAARELGRADLVFEATGFSPIVFDAAVYLLGKNGVMVLSSVTGGERRVDVGSDRFNLDLVLGNKVLVGTVNANGEHFEAGVRDLAVAEARFPGWLSRLLTHPVRGLEAYQEALGLLGAPGAIKVYVEVSPEG